MVRRPGYPGLVGSGPSATSVLVSSTSWRTPSEGRPTRVSTVWTSGLRARPGSRIGKAPMRALPPPTASPAGSRTSWGRSSTSWGDSKSGGGRGWGGGGLGHPFSGESLEQGNYRVGSQNRRRGGAAGGPEGMSGSRHEYWIERSEVPPRYLQLPSGPAARETRLAPLAQTFPSVLEAPWFPGCGPPLSPGPGPPGRPPGAAPGPFPGT